MIRKILIGLTDSIHAEQAVKYGFDLAKLLDAQVGLVNIVEPINVSTGGIGANEILGTPLEVMPIDYTDILDAQTNVSLSILNSTIKKYAGDLKVTGFNEYGSTAEGIISCAAEFNADMIVIGTHTKSGLDRLISGDVAEYVVRHSAIPVLVVPGKEV